MKIIGVILFFICWTNTTLASIETVSINIKTHETLYDELVKPVWENVPYSYSIPSKGSQSNTRNTIFFKMLKADINLGTPGTPLAKIFVNEQDKVTLGWQLQNINVNSVVKVTFKFKKFGIKITHSELFKINARKISKARSAIALNFNEEQLKFNLLSNSGFQFDHVKVTPKDGVGEVLKWIFDNIFSKKQVNDYLKKEINKEISSWANNQKVIKDLEYSVNSELRKLQDLKLKIGDAATEIGITFKDFLISKDALKIDLAMLFDNSNQELHPCADEVLMPEDGTGELIISHNFVQSLLNNFTIYQIYENNELQEPLFCFGYKEFDQNGLPLGNKETIRFLKKQTTFKYWVKPLTLPMLTYDSEQKEVKAKMRVKINIEPVGYPKLYIKNDAVYANIEGLFKMEFDSINGIHLKFQDFKITNLDGKLRFKYFKGTPPIPLPKKKIKNELEKLVTKELANSHQIIKLVDPTIEINEYLSIQTLNHKLMPNAHQVFFKLLNK